MELNEPELKLRIERKQGAAEGVTALSLVDVEGRSLPPWSPGAHIELDLGSGLIRQYSLCSPLDDRTEWKVCVLRQPAGRGGSRHICDRLEAGDVLIARGPRNNFELLPAKRYIFIAGGIGITPILPMIEQAEANGIPWTLTYGGRTLGSMAEALALRKNYSDKVRLWPQDEAGLMDLKAIISSAGEDSLVYCCGPEPLLQGLETVRQDVGLAAERVRTERFAPKVLGEPTRQETFTVDFARSGVTVDVGPGISIMDAAKAAGVPVLFSCSEGTCGTCETGVIAGAVEHRDSVLTQEEQEENQTMMICVSRAACDKLTLDL